MSTIASMMTAAFELGAAGWEVLPLNGKIPTTPHGVDDASTDPDTIRRWWSARPTANVGARVPRDLVVLDVDPRNGGAESLVGLVDVLGVLPATLTVVSGRGDGGHHRYFLRPSGSLKGRPAAGIDLKVHGYMVLPPSVHPATGRPYEWVDREPVPLPRPWVEFLRVDQARPRAAAAPAPERGGALVGWVATLQPGNRNSGLYWAACRAAEDGLLDGLHGDLVAAALACGLSQREALATLRSARRAA